MNHYKYWEDEDGYIRGAIWDDETPTIKTLMFDTLAEVRCEGALFQHGGKEGARAAFGKYPSEEIPREKFNIYVKPYIGFKQLGITMEI
ncbi:hypothetical protein [Christensenella minuta]|uniref:hypothetical protein n=1 Tax=Christensenella minuta TaxID=626937 RepID=UPI002157340F|nr:hypothetical protein [Christensenella minuta]